MAVNQRVFDSAILNRCTSSKAIALNTSSPANNLFYTDQDGTLYAAPANNFTDSFIKRSTDNGFSWDIDTIVFTGIRTDTPEGHCHCLFAQPDGYDGYVFTYTYNNRIWWVFTGIELLDSLYGEATTKYGTYTDLILSNYSVGCGDGKSLIYHVYLNANNDLRVIGCDVKRAFVDMLQDYVTYGTTNFRAGSLAAKSKEDKIHILGVIESTDQLGYIPFYKKQGHGDGHFSGFYQIASGTVVGGGTYVDLGVDVDGLGNLCAVYGERNGNPGTACSGFYAISNNAGVTWTPIYNPPPAGYSGYIDSTTGKVSTKADLLGGISGSFLISSVFMQNGSGTLFVKEVPSTPVDYIPSDVKLSIVGNNGVIKYSGLYNNWTNASTNTTTNFNKIVYNGSKFVAVGDAGLVMTCSNGTHWTQRTSNTTVNLHDIAYNGSGMLCAVGDSGVIITSTDAITWTSQTGALSNNLYCVANWNPVFMWTVGGTNGEFQTSNDGVTWLSRNTGQTSYNWLDIATNSTTLVAVAQYGIIRTTPNGVTWSARTSNVTDDLNSVCWTGSTFVACGNAGNVITNPSGTSTWTTQADPTAEDLNYVTAVNNNVYLMGQGNYFATSTNGSGTWNSLSVGMSAMGLASGYFPGSSTSTDDWRRVNSVDGNVIAGKFFKYINEAVPSFGDKSAIRLAYQVGSGNSPYGTDTVNSRIYHERLSNLAYPIVYSGVSFAKDDIDYYASGYISDKTSLYITKLDELGMTYSFSRYEPIENSMVNGIGSYSSPITFEAEACVDPGAYTFANVARSNTDFAEYIARDTRKIFYKPNLYLPRNFVLNAGGYLKRTIWTIRIMGNDYELAQIVPRFLDGAIIYYEANLYVIGPSNDPFKKVILPSET